MYTKYYLLVIYHVLNFVMINKGCLVSQTMPGFLSFVDLVSEKWVPSPPQFGRAASKP